MEQYPVGPQGLTAKEVAILACFKTRPCILVVMPGGVTTIPGAPGVVVEDDEENLPGEDKIGVFFNVRLSDLEVRAEVAGFLREVISAWEK